MIAETRALRPVDLRSSDNSERRPEACPFCPGHEDATPPSVDTVETDRGWQVRVVPNLYPAVEPNLSGQTARHPALGRHEVIIESPRHICSMSEQSADEIAHTLTIYRRRMCALRDEGRWKSVLIFKNVGAAAGASLEHVHSQLLALPMVPSDLAIEVNRCARYYAQKRTCLFCVLLARQFSRRTRLVLFDGQVSAICPYASRFAYETWFLPRKHASSFEAASDETLASVAWMLRSWVRSLERIIPQVSYNYYIHSAPFDTDCHDHYHWHIEAFPRIQRLAGFECGSGCFINSVGPDAAADRLRTELS